MSVITVIFFRLGYLVHSVGICAMTLSIETGVSRMQQYHHHDENIQLRKQLLGEGSSNNVLLRAPILSIR